MRREEERIICLKMSRQSKMTDVEKFVEPDDEIVTRSIMEAQRVRDEEERAIYSVRFAILRDAFKNMNISEPGPESSLEVVRAKYSKYKDIIHIQSSVERNKMYLMIMWLTIEYCLTNLFRLPFSGYTKEQMKQMHKYETYLTSLAERSLKGSNGETSDPRFDILTMAFVNAIAFGIVCALSRFVGKEQAESLKDTVMSVATGGDGKSAADILREVDNVTLSNKEHIKIEPQPQQNSDLLSSLAPLAPVLMGMLAQNNQAPAARKARRFA